MLLWQRTPFGVTRNGQPIELVSVRDVVDTGIEYESVMPGMVPLFEEREAAIYCRYNWSEWRALDFEERAYAVAQYRMHTIVAQHQHDAVSTAMDRRSAMRRSGDS